jgi:hypothetical protein
MKMAVMMIGGVILIGGVAAYLNPGPVTLPPSGGRWRQPIELSAQQKKIYSIAAATVGGLITIGGLVLKKSAPRKQPER